MIGDVFAYLVFFLVIALTYALACLGLNLQWGFTGLFNVGVAGFIAVGAYTSALLTAPPTPERLGGLAWPIAAGWVAAALAAGAVALGGRRRHPAIAPRLPGHRDVRHRGDDPAPRHEPRPAHRRAVRHPRRAPPVRRERGQPARPQRRLPRPGDRPRGRGLRWPWSGWCGARGGACCAACARTRRRPPRSASRRRPSACRPSSSAPMVMGLAGAVYAHFVGFVAPEDFLPDPHLPGLDDARPRRLGEQPRRHGRGAGRCGRSGARAAPPSPRRCRRSCRRAAPRSRPC